MTERSIWTTLPKERLNGYVTYLCLVSTVGGFILGVGIRGNIPQFITSVVIAAGVMYGGLNHLNNKYSEFHSAEQDFIRNQEYYINKYPLRFSDLKRKLDLNEENLKGEHV